MDGCAELAVSFCNGCQFSTSSFVARESSHLIFENCIEKKVYRAAIYVCTGYIIYFLELNLRMFH